jgi:hypothetical protein
MIDSGRIADVLEAAADLYESEKVEWCRGAWSRTGPVRAGEPPQLLSVCASTAIAMAAGLPVTASGVLEDMTGGVGQGHIKPEVALYGATRQIIDARLGTPLPSWNDDTAVVVEGSTEERIAMTSDGQRVILKRWRHRTRTKDEVIELFKETAKDLRNEQ